MTEEQYKKIDRNLKERPHGEWKYAIVDCYKSGYICTHCNGFAVIDGKSDGYSVTFCPNCGADMRGDDE
jgi:rubrerythrin